MEAAASLMIGMVVENYSAYGIQTWQPQRVKHALSFISEEIANNLDYTDANKCAISIGREMDVDITPYIVEYKYPVWVDLETPDVFIPQHDNAVITYIDRMKDEVKPALEQMEAYANSIGADFIILTGRTQGYIQLEKHRVKAFAEDYERIIYISPYVYLRDDYPNLFDLVPIGSIGLVDDSHIENLKHRHGAKLPLLKSETFSKTGIITSTIDSAAKYEYSLMETQFDDSVVVCDRKHADIWSPITFPFRYTGNENKGWMEILIYRNGHEVYKLPTHLNYSILSEYIKLTGKRAEMVRYENFEKEQEHVINTWLDDNNIIGYKDKPSVDMSDFQILVLGHKEEQFYTIEKQPYLQNINLNDIPTRFSASNSESRIYDMDFDSLFDKNTKHVGLVTGSWNMKYVGLNPIDKMHQWAAIRMLDDNTIICSDSCRASKFTSGRNPVLFDIYPEARQNHIDEFLELVNLKESDKATAIANQIIAPRHIVKQLFDFYKENEILDKVQFFMDKYKFTTKKEYMKNRGNGYLAETVTLLWIANNNFKIMPQETLKLGWYK